MKVPASWSTELDLLVACCRWPPSPTRSQAVRAKAAAVTDWSRFASVVRRHRVAALAADGLRRADIAVPASLPAEASSAARRALDMAREVRRLNGALAAAGIRPIFIKGATLAQIAYGELGIKQSWDIDFLVTEGEVVAACRELQRLGYRLVGSVVDERQLLRLMRFGKEAVLVHRDLGIAVELHWKLTDNERLLPGVGADSPIQQVAIGGKPVPTLADTPLFAYLCVHGTMHGWSRLKWLADLAAFLHGKEPGEIRRLCVDARHLGAGHAPAVALLLCHRLLQLPLYADQLGEMSEEPGVEALVATALRCMAHGGGSKEFDIFSAPGLRLARSHFGIVSGGRYAWSQLALLWAAAPERTRLPASLDIFYHLLRLPMFLQRRGKGLLARLRT